MIIDGHQGLKINLVMQNSGSLHIFTTSTCRTLTNKLDYIAHCGRECNLGTRKPAQFQARKPGFECVEKIGFDRFNIGCRYSTAKWAATLTERQKNRNFKKLG